MVDSTTIIAYSFARRLSASTRVGVNTRTIILIINQIHLNNIICGSSEVRYSRAQFTTTSEIYFKNKIKHI